jgi:hypothetical protein
MASPSASAGNSVQPSNGATQVNQGPRERPRYERPRITFQQPLEVMAVICSPPGKTGPAGCSYKSS